MDEIVTSIPGYISSEDFTSEDGTRDLSIVRFETVEALEIWRTHPEHQEAQRLAQELYFESYHIQVLTTVREYAFQRGEGRRASNKRMPIFRKTGYDILFRALKFTGGVKAMTNGRTIVITKFDAERLREAIRDAEREGYRGSRYIDSLKAELERAEIVEPEDVPDNVITMNSKVSLMNLDSGEEMVLTLVFPKDADISQDKISVLAPIGTAILGYHVGDTIEWEVPDGTSRLEVRKIIYQPEASGDYDL